MRVPFALVPLLVLAAAGCASGSPAPTLALRNLPNLGEVRYSCDGPPGFPPARLERPADAETEDHPSAAALRSAMAKGGDAIDPLPKSGYWLVYRDDRTAEYIARPAGAPDWGFAQARVENQGGTWRLVAWGDCRPAIVLNGFSRATWTLAPGTDKPGPDAMTFTALVTEAECTGGQAMGARLLPPSIAYFDDSVLILFAASPLVFDEAVVVSCPGNPASRIVVELAEPLGERQLLDGGLFPPADPVAPQF